MLHSPRGEDRVERHYLISQIAAIAPRWEPFGLRDQGVGILHCHGAHDPLFGLAVARLASIPTVIRTKHNHTLSRGPFSRWVYAAVTRALLEDLQRAACQRMVLSYSNQTLFERTLKGAP